MRKYLQRVSHSRFSQRNLTLRILSKITRKQDVKSSEEDADKNSKNIYKYKNLPVCPLHGPGNDINLFKVMQAQAKAMKSIWLIDCSGGSGWVRLQGDKKRPAEGQELNTILDNVVKEFLNQNKCEKATSTQKYGLEEEPENFDFEKSALGINETTLAGSGKIRRKCEGKSRSRDKDWTR